MPRVRVRIGRANSRQAYSLLVLTRAYFPYVQLGFDELYQRLLGQPRGEHLYLAAVQGDHTIGYAHLAFDAKRPSARLLGLGVLEEHRRHGLGQRLLGRSFSEARRRGARTLNLLVSEKNAPALALYRKHGFAVKGRLKKPFHGEHVLMLSRPLAPGKGLKPRRA